MLLIAAKLLAAGRTVKRRLTRLVAPGRGWRICRSMPSMLFKKVLHGMVAHSLSPTYDNSILIAILYTTFLQLQERDCT